MIQKSEYGATSFSDILVRHRTGIERQISRAAQYLYRERLLVVRRQRFEGFEEFGRMLTHTFRLSVFFGDSNALGKEWYATSGAACDFEFFGWLAELATLSDSVRPHKRRHRGRIVGDKSFQPEPTHVDICKIGILLD